MAVSLEVLALQNSATSQAVLEAYCKDETFIALSDRLCAEILKRDAEDGDKLQKGIQLGIDKGVLVKDVQVEATTRVNVSGKTADQVAQEIIDALGDAPSKGCVMTLQGLSGTGKGTTVAKLKEKLPNSQTWSNGNLFRSYTLLAVTYAEQKGCDLSEALKPEVLATFADMLSFDKFGDKFDVKIEGFGLKYFVSEVEKTVLKDSKVGTKIPTVAEVTQGEVIKFVQGALDKMAAGGINVLVEGREQTLNYIRTLHRFELILDDSTIIGKRQAALQMAGKAYEQVKGKDGADVKAALDAALAELAKQ
eukprot:TRINITY_DN1146_c0_g2_i1.p1 TRINITY_DN1146_c0_g2~~TRINITY_DN1146_c0_g2_i1.p1  ORF type:complete len:307 (-),score=114.27 TRINITY_DN1146_c0_g2_i1:281-1201(-)